MNPEKYLPSQEEIDLANNSMTEGQKGMEAQRQTDYENNEAAKRKGKTIREKITNAAKMLGAAAMMAGIGGTAGASETSGKIQESGKNSGHIEAFEMTIRSPLSVFQRYIEPKLKPDNLVKKYVEDGTTGSTWDDVFEYHYNNVIRKTGKIDNDSCKRITDIILEKAEGNINNVIPEKYRNNEEVRKITESRLARKIVTSAESVAKNTIRAYNEEISKENKQ